MAEACVLQRHTQQASTLWYGLRQGVWRTCRGPAPRSASAEAVRKRMSARLSAGPRPRSRKMSARAAGTRASRPPRHM